MPIKPDREYRNLGNFELDLAEEDIVTGYASTFEPYELYKDGDLTFYERIDPRAFEGADLNDVVFLRDHTGRVLARTKNGSVQLWTDDHGLAQKTNLGLTEASRAMLEDIRVGNYSQMSFSFVVARDHIDWIDDTKAVRVIDSIGKVYDVSAVAFPANPYTEIGLSARSLFDGAIEERTAERLAAAKRERARKALQLKVQILKGGTHGN